MGKKQLDLENLSVGTPTESTKCEAANIWNSIIMHNAERAAVYHYSNGDIHVAILPSPDEMIHLAFNFNDELLLDCIANIAELSEVKGKMHCSRVENLRKLQFEFK